MSTESVIEMRLPITGTADNTNEVLEHFYMEIKLSLHLMDSKVNKMGPCWYFYNYSYRLHEHCVKSSHSDEPFALQKIQNCGAR